MKKVQILLSAYNGEPYLKEQLESIINQDYSNFSLLIRDDGSSDNTLSIIKVYAAKYQNISFYQGENIGAIRSFFDLVRNSDLSAQYYSFSDQDDVWKPNKLSKAIEKLEAMDGAKPLLYCSRVTLVNAKLDSITSQIKKYEITPCFGNALVENICTGCTIVCNEHLFRMVREHIPQFTIMHDWWFYLTASCFGKIYFDEASYILYRQHSRNTIGASVTYRSELVNRMKRYRSNRGKISRQVQEFGELYHCENHKLIKNIAEAKKNLISRFKLVFDDTIYRQRKIDNLIFKLLFLLGSI